MALRLRRGTESERLLLDGSTPERAAPAPGELIYTTDQKRLFVGDGVTVGGNGVSAPVTSINAKVGAVTLTSDDIPEGTKQFYTADRALDAVGAMFQGGSHTNITFTYNSTLNTISAASAGAYTNNDALDSVGNALLDSNTRNTGITFSYNSTTNAISAVVAVSGTGTVTTGLATRLTYYATTGTTVAPTDSLTWSDATNILKIYNGTLTVTADGNSNRDILQLNTAFNGAGDTQLSFRKARGTEASPLAILPNDGLGTIQWLGYTGAGNTAAFQITAGAIGAVTPSVVTTGASGNGTTVTLTFATQASAPYPNGSTITISGVTPVGYNGSYVVTNCTTSSVSFLGTTTGSQTVAGKIDGVVRGIITFNAPDASGLLRPQFRFHPDGTAYIGPYNNFDNSTGQLRVTQQESAGGGNATVAVRNYFSDANGPNMSMVKARGTFLNPVIVQTGDVVGTINAFAFDGSTVNSRAAGISFTVDATPSTGKIPGAITLRAANLNGVLNTVLKINNPTTTTSGLVTVTGSLTATGTITATGAVSANQYTTTGSGAGTVTSATTLDLSAPVAVRVTGGGTFRLPSLTTTERTALSAVVGDMIYNTTLNKIQGYQNGFWINLDGTV